MKIILGSGSRSRQLVFEEAEVEFDVLTADIDEKVIRDSDPRKLVLKLAHAKADAILSKIIDPAILVTADQVTVWNGEIREKPESPEQARQWLSEYHGMPLEIINGLVVVNTETGKRAEGIDVSNIYFKQISAEAIEQAIEDGRILACAGAMRVEDKPLSDFVTQMEGTFDSTSGMPLALTRRLMELVV
ncbi:MAG: Maf family protein [Candidatus Uhrbacteria bacterium]|nr:Maf family protein [Candidatus Uhrbacteria bacterium]